jgi:cellulose biosynthesis protein BcsQ
MESSKIFCVYSFKGGVGKTTVTSNIGYSLFCENKKVCLIDIDPQMNLTEFLFSKYKRNHVFSNYIKILIKKDFKKITNVIELNGFTDIYSNLKKFEKRTFNDISVCKLIENNKGGKFDFINGNLKISEFSDNVSSGYLKQEENVYISNLKYLIDELKKEYDYIIIDLPPDMYPLNKVFLQYCDKIIGVLNPDAYGNISLFMINEFLSSSTYLGKIEKDKFLGYILNKAKITNNRKIISDAQKKNKELMTFCKENGINSMVGIIEDFNGKYNSIIHQEKLFLTEEIEFRKYNNDFGIGKVSRKRKYEHVSNQFKIIIKEIFNLNIVPDSLDTLTNKDTGIINIEDTEDVDMKEEEENEIINQLIQHTIIKTHEESNDNFEKENEEIQENWIEEEDIMSDD